MVPQERPLRTTYWDEMKTVKFNHYHFNGKHNSETGISLLGIYHPLLKLQYKIVSKIPGPMVPLRTSRNWVAILWEQKCTVVGSFKCNKPQCY